MKVEFPGIESAFKERTFDRYFDYRPVYELFSGALLRRLREGSFGGR